MSDVSIIYEQGVAAVKSKDYPKARQLLRTTLKNDPNHERAWLWLARAVEDDETKLKCVERALRLNPASPAGQEMHRRLLEKAEQALNQAIAADETRSSPFKDPADKYKNMPLGKEIASSGIRTMYQIRKGFGVLFFGFFTVIGLMGLPQILATPASEPLTFVVLISSFGIVAGICLYLLASTPFGKRIRVFENGVVYGTDEKGYIVRWHELDEVVLLRDIDLSMRAYGLQGLIAPLMPFYDMGLYTMNIVKDGTVVFSVDRNFQNFRDIGRLIRERSQPALVDRYLGQFQHKGQLELGSIKLSRIGIASNSKAIAWNDIAEINPYDASVNVVTSSHKTITLKPQGVSGNVLADVIMGIKNSA